MNLLSSHMGSHSYELDGKRHRNEQLKHQKPATHQQQQVTMKVSAKQQHGLLEVKSKPKEQTKLLSSKSLSMLVPRNLFFKKSPIDAKKDASNDRKMESGQLQTTKSFPANFLRPVLGSGEQNCKRMVNSTHLNIRSCSVLDSTLIHNAPTSNTTLKANSTTSDLANLSPIVCSSSSGEVIDMSWSETASSTNNSGNSNKTKTTKQTVGNQQRPETTDESTDNPPNELNNNKRFTSRFRHLKNTGLVLRDVKNSLGLRIKAKQESKAFAKLINETNTATPTKLYSPFDIYTDTSAIKQTLETPVGSQKQKASGQSASRRKLNLRNSKGTGVSLIGGENELAGRNQPPVDSCTPKGRIVQQHKRHLMQTANTKFTFDSPAGRHCETVKDVERFQQCIEDISKAIQTRGRSRTGTCNTLSR